MPGKRIGLALALAITSAIALARDQANAQSIDKRLDAFKKEMDRALNERFPDSRALIKSARDVRFLADEFAQRENEWDVRFTNGSIVRIAILSEKLEMATPYGKLSIPFRDLREIDCRIHFPEGVEAKIENAVKEIKGGNADARKKAFAELRGLNGYAYPALVQTARSADKDISKPALDLAKEMEKSDKWKLLTTRLDDRVVTSAFTITGVIQTVEIKVKTQFFGEQEIRLASTRSLRCAKGSGLAYAQKAKLLNSAPSDDEKFALVASLWVELRLGKNRVPLESPLTSEPAELVMKSLSRVTFTSTPPEADVWVGGVNYGKTQFVRYLSKNQSYSVTFKKGEKELTTPFSTARDVDACHGEF